MNKVKQKVFLIITLLPTTTAMTTIAINNANIL